MDKNLTYSIAVSAKTGTAVIDLRKLKSELDQVNQSTTGAGKSADGAAGMFGGLGSAAAAMAGGIGIAALAQKGLNIAMQEFSSAIDYRSKIEDMTDVMLTLTGSSQKAEAAMAWAKDFSMRTPFELEQVNEAFVKLNAYGLDAQRWMPTLGDTAAAMGKDVLMAVEAIADATVGEFERMKEFGVKVVQQGGQDFLLYTDRFGQQQKAMIDRNNKALVESTIQAIWNEKYSGAMENLSDNWSTVVSNLRTNWATFKDNELAGTIGSLKEAAQYISDILAARNALAAVDPRLKNIASLRDQREEATSFDQMRRIDEMIAREQEAYYAEQVKLIDQAGVDKAAAEEKAAAEAIAPLVDAAKKRLEEDAKAAEKAREQAAKDARKAADEKIEAAQKEAERWAAVQEETFLRNQEEWERKREQAAAWAEEQAVLDESERQALEDKYSIMQSYRDQDLIDDQQYTTIKKNLALQRQVMVTNEAAAYAGAGAAWIKALAGQNKAWAILESTKEGAMALQEFALALGAKAAGDYPQMANHLASMAAHYEAIKGLSQVGGGGGGGKGGGGSSGGGGGGSTGGPMGAEIVGDREPGLRRVTFVFEGVNPDQLITGAAVIRMGERLNEMFTEGSISNPFSSAGAGGNR